MSVPYLRETMQVHRDMQRGREPCRCRFCLEGLEQGLYTEADMIPPRKTPRSSWAHGRYTTYANRECRCEECREAHRVQHAKWRRRNRKAIRQGKVLRRLKNGAQLMACEICGESFAGERGLRIHRGLRHAA